MTAATPGSKDDAGYMPVAFDPPGVATERRADGSLRLRAARPLPEIPVHFGTVLDHWAARRPDHPALAQWQGGRWLTLTWRELAEQARAAAAGLLSLGMPRERPFAIFAQPSLAHGVIMFAAMQAGLNFAPVAPAYAMDGADREKLDHVLRLLDPPLVFVDDGPCYEARLPGRLPRDIPVFHFDRPLAGCRSRPWRDLLGSPDDPAVERARGEIKPDDCAKILLTSGSTGMPKGVVTPHRMLLSNQAAFASVHPYVREKPPVLVDWLPWNHCHAGNFTLGIALYNGGTYRFAAGRPIGREFDPVLDAMADEPPTAHFDVPQGYEMITARLEADPAFRDRFFSRLDLLFYAGSSMPETLWRRIEHASRASLGRTVVMTTGYGSTETGPLHLLATSPAPGPRRVGTPVPGAEVLLIPDGGRYEIRVRGGNVTPGYFRDPDRTAEAFDDEGYFITGDAVTMIDPRQPERGLYFEGRVGLNFKLTTGTWVRVDTVRVAVLEALGPLARDAIIAGHEKSHIGILIFPNIDGMRARSGSRGEGLDASALLALPDIRGAVAAALARYNAAHPGSSRQVACAMLLDEPSELYDRDLTDKRYLNQRSALMRRQDLANRLFDDPPPPGTIYPAP